MDAHSSVQSPDNLRNAISTGADLGMKAGCLLSALYSFLGVVVVLGIFGALDSVPFAVAASLPIYILILIPVLPLGAITGAILGWLSRKLSSIVPHQKFFLIGILVCALLLVVLHVAFFAFYPLAVEEDSGYTNESNNDNVSLADPLDLFTPMQTYLIFIGFPSILFIVGGGWVSQRLILKT